MKNAVFLSHTSSHMYSHVSGGWNGALSDRQLQISSNMIPNEISSLCFADMDLPYAHQGLFAANPPSTYFSGSMMVLPPPAGQNLKDHKPQGQGPSTSRPLHSHIFQSPVDTADSRNVVQVIQRKRKRSVEEGLPDVIQSQVSSDDDTRDAIYSTTNEWTRVGTTSNATKRTMTFLQPELPLIQKEKAPAMKRSQKITDKITTLQKLVSPYGKTDTASVLLEACISIKALQHQIQELFHMLPDNSIMLHTFNKQGERPRDLQRKGLYLAPVSHAEKLTGDPSRYSPQW